MSSRPPIGIAVTGEQAAALISSRRLAADLDGSGIAFAVAGIDRIDPLAAPTATVESTIAITALSARTARLGWLAAAAVHRDHPYNLARRVASADHLSGGRVGLMLGLRDVYAPSGVAEDAAVWGGAALGPAAPISPQTTADAALAIRKLWQSWPADAIVFDKASRIYANGERILRVDHRGTFDISGPLTVPSTPQSSPVLGWRAASVSEAAVARQSAELVLWPADSPDDLAVVAALPGAARLFAEVAVSEDGSAHRVGELLSKASITGIVLRPAPSVAALEALIRRTLPELRAAGALACDGALLRERIPLPAVEPLPVGSQPAFPAPTPYDADAIDSKWW